MKCRIPQNVNPLDAKLMVTEKTMYALPRPALGEIVYTTDTQKVYVYTEEGWQPLGDNVKLEGEGLKMSLYDLNQSIISQLPELTELDDKINLINEYKTNTANQYYMLYGKDISYFTLFHCQNPIFTGNYPTLGEEVIDCLKSIGIIKCIDYTENKDAIEIWVDYNDTSVCIYLFPYDNGVINCYNS